MDILVDVAPAEIAVRVCMRAPQADFATTAAQALDAWHALNTVTRPVSKTLVFQRTTTAARHRTVLQV